MQTIRKILSEKGSEIWSTSPGATVYDALQIMADKDVGALPVLDHEKLVGIFSERDYARKVILLGKSSKKTLVKEIMTPHVIYSTPDMTNEQGLTLMTAKHIRHLPVIERDALAGMISIGDLVRSIISEQKEMITQLEQYILHYTSIT
ncbi:MAG: histidine kinase [Chloroflexi bacterium RBG_19FT_COMBO_50_10]|nr:MAG: histidine kinase [Chloroflexi bacterium RBG_16_47_49]OGO62460.1 MAG: histidine kinase [Chloroflexi bacterium RBG_19FT_COMBO_50_10]